MTCNTGYYKTSDVLRFGIPLIILLCLIITPLIYLVTWKSEHILDRKRLCLP